MNAVEQVINKLRACVDDPMWPDHAEVSKNLLRNAITYLNEVEALREGSNPKGECPPGPSAEHEEPGRNDAPKENKSETPAAGGTT
jgi:hypothetical protein